MPEQDIKNLFLELCREEQKLVREMIEGMVLPDADAPIQVRLDVVGEELGRIKSRVSPEVIQEWTSELHG